MLRFSVKRAPFKRFAKGFPIARVLVAAEIAGMAWAHLAKLNGIQRRRMVALLVKSRGLRSRLSDPEKGELAALVALAEPRLLAGSVAWRLIPLPVPKRVLYGPRDAPRPEGHTAGSLRAAGVRRARED